MTRDKIMARIQYTLGLQDDTTFSETDFVTDLIYEGIVDIVARTRPGARVINMTTTADTQTHDMSTFSIISLLDLASLGADDEWSFLDRYSREDIEAIQAKGGKGYCYEEPLLWISPIGEQTLRVFGVFRPQRMPDGNASPSHKDYGGLAEEFHPTIITYCLWKGGEYMQHEASGNGEKWRVQYEGPDGNGGELAKIKRILGKRVTPGGARRRNPMRTVGRVPNLSHFTGG
jgi:hypothetical protein